MPSKVQTSETLVSKEGSNKVPQKTKLSLFDNEDDDDDADLFAVGSSSTSKMTKSPTSDASKVSLVLYCNVLYGAVAELSLLSVKALITLVIFVVMMDYNSPCTTFFPVQSLFIINPSCHPLTSVSHAECDKISSLPVNEIVV